MKSLVVNTGCVPDWMYATSLTVLGFVAWRVWRTRTRQTAA